MRPSLVNTKNREKQAGESKGAPALLSCQAPTLRPHCLPTSRSGASLFPLGSVSIGGAALRAPPPEKPMTKVGWSAVSIVPRPRRSIFCRAVAIGGVCAATTFSYALTASAQDQIWLKDRRYTEGSGIRVGNFELHPGVAAEVGYETNYLRTADELNPAGSVRIRVTPSLSLSTLGPQRMEGGGTAPPPDVEFRATAALTYNEFFGVSGDPNLQTALSAQRNLSGNLDLNLNIRPRREWSGTLFAGVGRSIQPSETGLFDSFQGAFDRFLVRAGGELAWAPGAGLLDWRLGYRFGGTLFEQSVVGGLTNLEHTIQTRGRWRFLPRTALLYDAKFGFINYVNAGGGSAGGFTKTGSHPLRVQLGVSGLITPSFGVLAMGGWGSSFYEPVGERNDFDSFIGQAEIKWYLTPNASPSPTAPATSQSSLSLGFIRDFQDSFIGTYVERDRAYANFSYFFGGSVLVVVDGGVGPMVYPDIEAGVGSPSTQAGWTDIRYDASVFGEYRIKDYFGINALIRYSGNASSTRIAVEGDNNSLQWQSFEAYLGARFMM